MKVLLYGKHDWQAFYCKGQAARVSNLAFHMGLLDSDTAKIVMGKLKDAVGRGTKLESLALQAA